MAFRLRAALTAPMYGRSLARTAATVSRGRAFHATAGRNGLAELANAKAATTGYDASQYPPGPDMDVLYVGGGGAMFGTTEGPWNISSRLEHRMGPRLKVLGVVDPNKARVGATLQKKAGTFVGSAYENTGLFNTVEDYIAAAKSGSVKAPEAIFIAAPPVFRGSLTKGKDLEIQLMDAFPNAHFFLEKPVATAVPWDKSVADTKVIAKRFAEHKGVVSVGVSPPTWIRNKLISRYVLRYVKGAQEMKKILKENNLRVMNTVARYISSYEFSPKSPWWDITKLQGPVVEQGTHLCDLSRHFGGDIITDSIAAHALEAYEEPAQLGTMQFDETEIPLRNRIPRATAACWKYKSGAVGTFMHGLTMRGTDYAIEIEVYADGHQLILQDPFGQPSLSVRRPGNDIPEVTPLMGDDPYQSEIDAFIDAIEGNGEPRILSDFADAAKTYEMTWYIRNAAEASSRKVREANGIVLPDAPAEAEGADAWRKADT